MATDPLSVLKHEGFRNPASVQVATWETIEPKAWEVFRIFLGDDRKWAEKAWRLMERTPLVYYSDRIEFTKVMIRLFALADLYHVFARLLGCTGAEAPRVYDEWAANCEADRFLLALLAGEQYWSEKYVDVDRGGPHECVDALIDQEYDHVLQLLIHGFGGRDGLVESLMESVEPDALDEDHRLMSLEDAQATGMEITISRETYHLIEWKKGGFARSGVEGLDGG